MHPQVRAILVRLAQRRRKARQLVRQYQEQGMCEALIDEARAHAIEAGYAFQSAKEAAFTPEKPT